MGSNYFGDQPNNNYMNQLSRGTTGIFRSSSSPSRKGKKNSSDKPKQPQRGLGVAQLEKIRLHAELGCSTPNYHHHHHNLYNNPSDFIQDPISSSSPSYNGFHGHMMGLPDYDRANSTYGDSQSTNISRWHHNNASGSETQHYFVEPITSATSFFEPGMQGSLKNKNKNKKKKEMMDLMGSGGHNSESQDVDLELRL